MSAEVNPLTIVTPRARRRRLMGKFMEGVATMAAVLAIVVISVAKKGLPALNVDFFTKTPVPFGSTGGGIKNAIIGTIIMTAMGMAFAVPLGVLIAIFNTEFASPQIAEGIRLTLNVLAGVPTIVIGIFIFGLLVVGNGQSAIAASVGLSIVMLPIIARATEEVLLLVPPALREAGMALGATRTRTVLTVILPTAVGGIVTATIVAVARAAGETAPLLFTSALVFTPPGASVPVDPTQQLASMPLVIFVYSEQADKHLNDQAWAAAFLLMAFVLVSSLTARALLARSQRKLTRR
jgi:phosphate transport system permease protein